MFAQHDCRCINLGFHSYPRHLQSRLNISLSCPASVFVSQLAVSASRQSAVLASCALTPPHLASCALGSVDSPSTDSLVVTTLASMAGRIDIESFWPWMPKTTLAVDPDGRVQVVLAPAENKMADAPKCRRSDFVPAE